MAVVSAAVLKSYFETGDKPTQAQFVDFIDSALSGGGEGSFVSGTAQPSGIDDTTTIQTALNSGASLVILDANATWITTGVTVPDDVTFEIRGNLKYRTPYTVTGISRSGLVATITYIKDQGATAPSTSDIITVTDPNLDTWTGAFNPSAASSGSLSYVMRGTPGTSPSAANIALTVNARMIILGNRSKVIMAGGFLDGAHSVGLGKHYISGTYSSGKDSPGAYNISCKNFAQLTPNLAGNISTRDIEPGIVQFESCTRWKTTGDTNLGCSWLVKARFCSDGKAVGFSGNQHSIKGIGFVGGSRNKGVGCDFQGTIGASYPIHYEAWGGNANIDSYNNQLYDPTSSIVYGVYDSEFIGCSGIGGLGGFLFSKSVRCYTKSCKQTGGSDVGCDWEGCKDSGDIGGDYWDNANGNISAFYYTDNVTFVGTNCGISGTAYPFAIHAISYFQGAISSDCRGITLEGVNFKNNSTAMRPLNIDPQRTSLKIHGGKFLNLYPDFGGAFDGLEVKDTTWRVNLPGNQISAFQALAPGFINGEFTFKNNKVILEGGYGDYITNAKVENGGKGFTSNDIGLPFYLTSGAATLGGTGPRTRGFISSVASSAIAGVYIVDGGSWIDASLLSSPNTIVADVNNAFAGSAATVSIQYARGGIGPYDIVNVTGGASFQQVDVGQYLTFKNVTGNPGCKLKIKQVNNGSGSGPVTQLGISVVGLRINNVSRNYAATQILNPKSGAGGTAISSDTFTASIASVDVSGAIVSADVKNDGAYTDMPISPVEVCANTGNGAKARLELITGLYTQFPTSTIACTVAPGSSVNGTGVKVRSAPTGVGVVVDRDLQVSRQYSPFLITDNVVKGFPFSIYVDGRSNSGANAYHHISRNITDGPILSRYGSRSLLYAEDNQDSILISSRNVDLLDVEGAFLHSKVNWNPGGSTGLITGNMETTAFTVYGASAGDIVDVIPPYNLQGQILTSYVTAATSADKVKLQLSNQQYVIASVLASLGSIPAATTVIVTASTFGASAGNFASPYTSNVTANSNIILQATPRDGDVLFKFTNPNALAATPSIPLTIFNAAVSQRTNTISGVWEIYVRKK